MFLKKLKRFFTNKVIRFGYLNRLGFYNRLSDKDFLKKLYRIRMGKELNLENPVTFNEKLQWLKLNDRRIEYVSMVDKCKVKNYVANIIGSEYIIPTIGVWKKFDEIDFEALPNKFVLKCTHDSGGLVICKDKSAFSPSLAKKKINKSLRQNYYYASREWPYKDVEPLIIAEEYMEDSDTGELRDYKFFCFDGVPKALFVATDRQKSGEEVKFDFFDIDYNHLDLRNGHNNANNPPEKPLQFELMKELAKKLSQNIPHVRVDFYEVNGKVYFGEMTFFHFSGLVPFEPVEWDYEFGNYINLPNTNNDKR